MEKLILTDLTGSAVVSLDDIVYCEAQSNCTLFYFRNGSRKLICKTLKEFEKKLPSERFVRIHRKHLVNIMHVVYYHRSSERQLRLLNNVELQISLRCHKAFLSRLHQYIQR